MESGVILELARLAPRRATLDTWNRVYRCNEEFFDKLCSDDVLFDATKCADFEKGEGQGLFSFLDNDTSLDDDLQFLRLFAKCDYSWKAIENLCKVAYLSESLYRWVSDKRWLRTVIEAHPQRAKQLVFHSNVVPREEYFRVAPANGICAKQGCTEVFFRIGGGDPRSRQCGGKCDLAERLKQTGDYSLCPAEEGARSANELLPSLEERPDLVKAFPEGSDGKVSVISYRKCLFARKEFRLEGGQVHPSFVNEREVAKKVLHPNIVHCSSSAEKEYLYGTGYYSCLIMELLQNDLDGVLLDLARIEDYFSFRDSILVLLQIAKAMKHLHDMNFVHGDLKPGNIFVSRLAMSHSDEDNRFHLIKVGDFGRTQRVEESGASQYFDFNIGSRYHTAPEVLPLRGPSQPRLVPESIDLKKTDAYSFGVIAYQVLTGLPSTDLGKKKKPNWFPRFRQDPTPTKYSRDAVMKPDGDPAQWRPSCLFDGPLRGNRSMLLPLVKECWSSSPQARPDFASICERMQTLFDERCPSNLRISEDSSYVLDRL